MQQTKHISSNSIFIPQNWRILVTGITSIHGWPIWNELNAHVTQDRIRGIRPPKMSVPDGPNVASICISDADAIRDFCADFSPTHIVYCSGVCDLDVCEERPAWARLINTGGAETISRLFSQSCHVLFLSTDLVFSGNNPPDGGYDENAVPDPVSVAGKTFLDAEEVIMRTCPRHCIIRLGLPVGQSITGDKGGYDWIKSRFERTLPVTLFHDEYRSCLSCEMVTDMTMTMLMNEYTGLFHYGGKESVSLYELGLHVLRQGGYPAHLFNGISRHEEINGPPRIGDVSLNSNKIKKLIREPAAGQAKFKLAN